MGYNTNFSGELKFTNDPTVSQLNELKKYLGEDCRKHPEWNMREYTYIDLELTEDLTGICWNGSEKTYDLTEKINFIIKQMKEKFPDFGLEGQMLAQGEDIGDVWKIVIDDGEAVEKDIPLNYTIHTCPECGCQFKDEN